MQPAGRESHVGEARNGFVSGLPSSPERVELDFVNSRAERVTARYADICELDVDAIVNPAHTDLLGGGGLDGIIHDAAGPALVEACRNLNGCPVGDAKSTPGFRLRARWVIHTVGPIWHGGTQNERQLLASCYKRCLEEAVSVGARSVAFPGISTGLHRFPGGLAAEIAVGEVNDFLLGSPEPHEVIFVCFDNTAMRAYERELANRSA